MRELRLEWFLITVGFICIVTSAAMPRSTFTTVVFGIGMFAAGMLVARGLWCESEPGESPKETPAPLRSEMAAVRHNVSAARERIDAGEWDHALMDLGDAINGITRVIERQEVTR